MIEKCGVWSGVVGARVVYLRRLGVVDRSWGWEGLKELRFWCLRLIVGMEEGLDVIGFFSGEYGFWWWFG